MQLRVALQPSAYTILLLHLLRCWNYRQASLGAYEGSLPQMSSPKPPVKSLLYSQLTGTKKGGGVIPTGGMGPILEDRDYEMSHEAKGLADFSKSIINSKVGGGLWKISLPQRHERFMQIVVQF